jgi:hypothetical protein
MTSTRKIAIVGLLILPVAALVSGGLEAALWTAGVSCLTYGFGSGLVEI